MILPLPLLPNYLLPLMPPTLLPKLHTNLFFCSSIFFIIRFTQQTSPACFSVPVSSPFHCPPHPSFLPSLILSALGNLILFFFSCSLLSLLSHTTSLTAPCLASFPLLSRLSVFTLHVSPTLASLSTFPSSVYSCILIPLTSLPLLPLPLFPFIPFRFITSHFRHH